MQNFKVRQISHVFSFLSCVLYAKACLFQPENIQWKWDEEDHERIVDTSCECGIDGPPGSPQPWNLHIITQMDSGPPRNCTGTIITSNLLVTSHECLELPGKRFGVYDAWKPHTKPQNMMDYSKIIISTNRTAESGITFQVVNIIYNSWFGVTSVISGAPEDDLVIIEVSPDFRAKSAYLAPICILEYYDSFEDFVGQGALYNSVAASYEYDKLSENNTTEGKSWDYFENCREDFPISGKIFGQIVQDEECGTTLYGIDEEELIENYLMCFKRETFKTAKLAGGQLIIQSMIDDRRNFLVGVAAARKFGRNGTKYVPFTPISRFIKYIEYHANASSSRWCNSGMLILNDDGGDGLSPMGATWSTDVITDQNEEEKKRKDKAYERDESLECFCGIENKEEGSPPHESSNKSVSVNGTSVISQYPWMTYIRGFQNESDEVGEFCTGTVINDRMILTAARCIFMVNWEERTVIQKSPIDLFISAQIPSDPQAFRRNVTHVITHPDFERVTVQSEDGNEGLRFSRDACILVLNESLEFVSCGNGLRPICLPTLIKHSDLRYLGDYLWVVGWEYGNPKDKEGNVTETFHKIKVTVPDSCPGSRNPDFCARIIIEDSPENFEKAYYGTLQMQVDNYVWTQIGVVDSDPAGNRIPVEDKRKYKWFGNVQYIAYFLNYHAKQFGAKWCQSPPH